MLIRGGRREEGRRGEEGEEGGNKEGRRREEGGRKEGREKEERKKGLNVEIQLLKRTRPE